MIYLFLNRTKKIKMKQRASKRKKRLFCVSFERTVLIGW